MSSGDYKFYPYDDPFQLRFHKDFIMAGNKMPCRDPGDVAREILMGKFEPTKPITYLDFMEQQMLSSSTTSLMLD